GAAALGAGYLGGHLSFGRRIGTGVRGFGEADQRTDVAGSDTPRAASPRAEETVVEELVVDELVVSDDPSAASSPRMRDDEVRGPAASDLLGVREAAKELTVPEEQVRTMV